MVLLTALRDVRSGSTYFEDRRKSPIVSEKKETDGGSSLSSRTETLFQVQSPSKSGVLVGGFRTTRTPRTPSLSVNYFRNSPTFSLFDFGSPFSLR